VQPPSGLRRPPRKRRPADGVPLDAVAPGTPAPVTEPVAGRNRRRTASAAAGSPAGPPAGPSAGPFGQRVGRRAGRPVGRDGSRRLARRAGSGRGRRATSSRAGTAGGCARRAVSASDAGERRGPLGAQGEHRRGAQHQQPTRRAGNQVSPRRLRRRKAAIGLDAGRRRARSPGRASLGRRRPRAAAAAAPPAGGPRPPAASGRRRPGRRRGRQVLGRRPGGARFLRARLAPAADGGAAGLGGPAPSGAARSAGPRAAGCAMPAERRAAGAAAGAAAAGNLHRRRLLRWRLDADGRRQLFPGPRARPSTSRAPPPRRPTAGRGLQQDVHRGAAHPELAAVDEVERRRS